MLRVVTSKSAAAVLAAGALTVSAGLASTGVASAAPARAAAVNYVHCKLVNGGNYPPAHCYIVFDHTTYKHGAKVHFRSAGDFKPGERIKVVLLCTKGYKKTEPNKAPAYSRHAVNVHGRAHGHFEIPAKAPVGRCAIEITGQTSHDEVVGSFTVKK